MDVPVSGWFRETPSSNTAAMERFIEAKNSRLEKLSTEQLSNLQMLIDQALCMAGV